MVKLLAKIFIKNRHDYADAAVRRAYGLLCSVLGIVLNALLFGAKYVIGVISGSVAIMADAFNNLSDAGSSVITLLGFKLSGRRPDRDHPFGHGRIEYLSGLAVSVFVIVMGVNLARTSVEKIISPSAVEFSIATVIVLALSIAVKTYMFLYNRAIGKKINSSASRATAADSLSDAASTAVVLASAVVSHLFSVQIDGWCGLAVSLFVFYNGCVSVRDTLSPLLGQAPDGEFVERIREIVLAHGDIEGIHDLVVHDYGPGRVFISLHAEVSADGDILALHDTIDLAERELAEALGCEAVIHMDPISTNDERVNEMRAWLSQEVKLLGENVSIHDLRMVEGPTHTNVIFDVALPADFPLSDGDVTRRLENLVSARENLFAVITVDRIYV